MKNTHHSEPAHLTHHILDNNEQISANQRSHVDRSFEGATAAKQPHLNSKRKDLYISDIINVQSLLNIRAMQSRQRRRNSLSFQDRIIINVCGDRYETHRTTLELYPETLLGNNKRRKYYYDKTRNEYFFDRNRACFEAILYYYQSNGRLRRPTYIPIDIFLEEVTFFQLGEEALNQLRIDENLEEVKKVRLPKNRFRRHLWATMEYPHYSFIAKVVNIVSLLMILLSTIILAVESLPQYNSLEHTNCGKPQNVSNSSIVTRSNYTNETVSNLSATINDCQIFFKSPFFIIQTICVGYFTIELLLRIISAPSILSFIKNIMNWIDVLAIVPYFITLGIRLGGRENQLDARDFVGLRLLRVLRFIRVVKLYRVFKNVKSLRVLAATLRQSVPDFIIMIIILTLSSFLFGAATYYAEYDTNYEEFDSIWTATYWGVITITSVGYGDISPITPIGRVIACLCALFGAATIGMLVSVLVDRYQRVFARKLYINEDVIDFDEYSDDENTDGDSRGSSGQIRRRANTKEIEDPDARAKVNAAFERENTTTTTDVTDVLPKPDIQTGIETPTNQCNNRVHFIFGYVNDENHEPSSDVIETISSVIAQKQSEGDNIQLNVMSDEQQRSSSPYKVKFHISTPSDDDSDEDEELTEIVSGCGSKGNVLKRFECSPSPRIDRQIDKSEKKIESIFK